MTYDVDIKKGFDSYIQTLEGFVQEAQPTDMLRRHLQSALTVSKGIEVGQPENYRQLIEYIAQVSHDYGWSFPVNTIEEACETSFYSFRDTMERIIGGMTLNERLYFFGYLDEYENLKPIERSARERIELLLFMKR